MLTECPPASSEDPARDLTSEAGKLRPQLDGGGQNTVHQPRVSTGRGSFDSSLSRPGQIGFKETGGSKGKLALLLTDFEVRAVPLPEAQELCRTAGEALQTLTVSAQTEKFPEIQLSRRPAVVQLQEEQTVGEAYGLLLSLLEPSGPVPKPRRGSCSGSGGQRRSLVEALRSGTETGERVLKLQSNTEPSKTNGAAKSGGSCDSEESPYWRKSGENVRGSAYKRLDSLEETIRELEKTLMEIGGHPTVEQLYVETPAPPLMTTRGPGKPPVPPKPSSLSPVFVQVDADPRSMLCLLFFLLHCFSVGDCWNFTFRLLMSAPPPRPNPHVIAFKKKKKTKKTERNNKESDRQQISSLLVCWVISGGAAVPLSSGLINRFCIDPSPSATLCVLRLLPSLRCSVTPADKRCKTYD